MSVLPIRCPKCPCTQVYRYISSVTVLTVMCPQCEFTWSVEMSSVSSATREQVAFESLDQTSEHATRPRGPH